MLIQYDSIEYGSNITYRKVDGIKEIDLSRMKYWCLLIATKKEEWISHFKDRMLTIDNNFELKDPTENQQVTTLSGFVLLSLAVQKKNKNASMLGMG